MDIYLIRHSAVYNPNKLCYGQSEIPLEENFTVDFDWIKDALQAQFTADTLFISSPFRRCTKLADYLSDGYYQINNQITEINFGSWEMKPWSKIDEHEMNPWMQDFVNYRIPKGENFIDLFERVISFYEEIIQKEVKNIILVTHAGVIRSLVSYVLDFPLENAFNLQVDYSSISKIEYDEQNKLSKVVYLNRTLEA